MAHDEQRGKRTYTPVLGLLSEDDLASLHRDTPANEAAQPVAPERSPATLELSVIVPVRNEEARLPGLLESLLVKNDTIFALDTEWELLLIDDGSTDGSRALMDEAARDHTGVFVLDAPALDPAAFTGKSNACWFGAQKARGRWLLFTDADTLHEPNDLRHALHEAKKHRVALLSYSPRQILTGFAQRALMPLVFSELASVYKMSDVNDPAKRTAAANGQFLMVERETYFAVGGHRAVGRNVLEDVELAWNVKRSRERNGLQGIRFRYAPDAVAARMYRGFGDMVEGWTKNLALLFPHALQLAAWRLLDVLLLLLPLLLLQPYLVLWQKAAIIVIWLRTLWRFYHRVARSHMGLANCALSPLGLPLFIWLLLRSWMAHKMTHRVAWKGRSYRT